AGASLPPVTLAVSFPAGSTSVALSAHVSGGGDQSTTNNDVHDTATVRYPDLIIANAHTGPFAAGQPATWTLSVKNIGAVQTFGFVAVQDMLPAGFVGSAMSGDGWTCSAQELSCVRDDALAAGASYPAITLTAQVPANASGPVMNTATVSGG